MARDPYCRNCRYPLKGLTESSKCPECGKPIVEVLERGPLMMIGRRYTSPIAIFGLPLVQIAVGPHEDERRGHARGIIAIGDSATGWLAIGGLARGFIACGGFAFGIVAIGGVAAGLLGVGGVAAGICASGGLAAGAVGQGGLVVAGVAVSAGLGLAYYARAGVTHAVYGLGGNARDPEAITFFNEYAWLFGSGPADLRFVLWVAIATFLLAVVLFLIATVGYLARSRHLERSDSQMR